MAPLSRRQGDGGEHRLVTQLREDEGRADRQQRHAPRALRAVLVSFAQLVPAQRPGHEAEEGQASGETPVGRPAKGPPLVSAYGTDPESYLPPHTSHLATRPRPTASTTAWSARSSRSSTAPASARRRGRRRATSRPRPGSSERQSGCARRSTPRTRPRGELQSGPLPASAAGCREGTTPSSAASGRRRDGGVEGRQQWPDDE